MKWFNVLYWTSVAFMLPLTILTCIPDTSIHLFQGGTVLMRLFPPFGLITCLLFLLYLIAKWLHKQSPKPGAALIIALFILWFFSGRTIGVYFTGVINTGWFYISTNKIPLNISDGEIASPDISKVRKDGPLFISIINKGVEEKIYVGPLHTKSIVEEVRNTIAN